MEFNNDVILYKSSSNISHSQVFLIAEKLKKKNFEIRNISTKCLVEDGVEKNLLTISMDSVVCTLDIKLCNKCTIGVQDPFMGTIKEEIDGVISLTSDWNEISENSFEKFIELRNYAIQYIDTGHNDISKIDNCVYPINDDMIPIDNSGDIPF